VRIVYDSQIFWRQRYGGISRYFAEIAERIARSPGAEVRVLAPIHMNAYLEEAPRGLVRGRRLELRPPLFRFRGVINEALSAGALRLSSADLVHETYYASRSIAPRGTKVVLTVYDMIHELRPADFDHLDRTTVHKRRAIARADHVICISENTRQDLLRLEPEVDPAKVSVIHLGQSLRAMEATSDGPEAGGEAPAYLLFVGDRRGYKNFSALMQAYARSPRLRASVRLVAFGGPPFGESELAALRHEGLSPRDVVHASGGDAELLRLYTGATALVYPSLYEGFGIPVLEAMTVGCPVIAASTSSIPEVAGDAAELFDPAVPGALSIALERVVTDDDRRAELRLRGPRRAMAFSWDRCAADTLLLYRRMLDG
jgi:glycosyltransferase involved in cell wall biosynthesis